MHGIFRFGVADSVDQWPAAACTRSGESSIVPAGCLCAQQDAANVISILHR
jgi:hypothetical protein